MNKNNLEEKRAYYLEKMSKPFIEVIDDDNNLIKVNEPIRNQQEGSQKSIEDTRKRFLEKMSKPYVRVDGEMDEETRNRVSGKYIFVKTTDLSIPTLQELEGISLQK